MKLKSKTFYINHDESDEDDVDDMLNDWLSDIEIEIVNIVNREHLLIIFYKKAGRKEKLEHLKNLGNDQ